MRDLRANLDSCLSRFLQLALAPIQVTARGVGLPKPSCGLGYAQANQFHIDDAAHRGRVQPRLAGLQPDSSQNQAGLACFSAPSATHLFRNTEFFSA